MTPVFRFAPSPNGDLHLGHALSALLNFEMARKAGGRFQLRIEDIDPARCRPEYEAGIYDDLRWLGLDWEQPVRRQSEHVADYRTALEGLQRRGLVYPAFLSRAEVRSRVQVFESDGGTWPRDPDGTPLYPDEERDLDPSVATLRIAAGDRHMWRLDMRKALSAIGRPEGGNPPSVAAGNKLHWIETGTGNRQSIPADPSIWGDVVLWRWDAPSSYHLSVVLDDALQGVTHVVRGHDLYAATPVHRLLQTLLGLPEPVYHHHPLLLDDDGEKLSKSLGSTGLRQLRQGGMTPSDIRRRIGIDRLLA
jgi:glutamyl-Q tRNA(Asp) synthetase